jgi:NAD(P)-dependent dehydrogenase (short-subunit alcohol dehydrogenase family)
MGQRAVSAYVTGKTALISGGASGIGAAFARQLAAHGAKVVIADRQLALAEELAAELRQAGGQVTAVELDVRDFDAWKRVADAIGRIDLFFNNAGIVVGGEMSGYQRRDWDDVIDVNLRGVVYGIQTIYPRMVAQGAGHIINTASMAGLIAAIGQGAYTTTKHAVVGLSKALRAEGSLHGVRVSVLCPGVIRTPILSYGKYGRVGFEGVTPEKMNKLWERTFPMDVDVFARRALGAIACGKAIIVLPRWWKIAWYLERISPWLSLTLAAMGMRKMRRELAAMSARPPS